MTEAPACTCRTCDPRPFRFVVCATCGNKRCPHATDHRHACTGSNEPGQPGSVYGTLLGGASGDFGGKAKP